MENIVSETPVDKGIMSIMGQSGDTKVVWSRGNPDEIENARRTFYDLKERGFKAFAVNKLGNKGEQIDEFNENAEKLIMVPQMRGG